MNNFSESLTYVTYLEPFKYTCKTGELFTVWNKRGAEANSIYIATKNWFHQSTITVVVEFLCSTQARRIAKFNIRSSNIEDKILPEGDTKFFEKIWSNVEEAVDTIRCSGI